MMYRLFILVSNPVIRSVMLALTGSFLVMFLCIHIVGNYLFFGGPELYNNYSHFLLSLPVIYLIEAVLLVCFFYHGIFGIYQRLRRARERSYAIRRDAPRSRRNIASRYAHVTGMIIGAFLIIHVITMKFGEPDIPGPQRNMWQYTFDMFSHGWVVILYELVMVILGVHLFHGLGTLYESVGIAHRTWMRRIGQALAVCLALAYVSFPVLVYFYGELR